MAPNRRCVALLVAGATALLASGCASTLGFQTPCSVWMSMNGADQRSTIDNMDQQEGAPKSSDEEVWNFERLATDYCKHPFSNDDTIMGMLASRPQ